VANLDFGSGGEEKQFLWFIEFLLTGESGAEGRMGEDDRGDDAAGLWWAQLFSLKNGIGASVNMILLGWENGLFKWNRSRCY